MPYPIYGIDKEGGEAIRARARPAHFAYLDRHREIIVLGGATPAADDRRTGRVRIVNVPDRAAAEGD